MYNIEKKENGEEMHLEKENATSLEAFDFQQLLIDGREVLNIIGFLAPEIETVCIPRERRGVPITKIQENAFNSDIVGMKSGKHDSSQHKMREVVLSENIDTLDTGAFYGAVTLEEIRLSDQITEIPERCFGECKRLKNVPITANVERFGPYAFTQCDVLTEVSELPENMEILAGCFAKCKKLERVVLPNGMKRIHDDTFSNCSCLESVVIPESIQEIGEGAFENCISLKEIQLPNGLKKIERRAFSGCQSLRRVVIPMSLERLEDAFDNGVTLVSESEQPAVQFFIEQYKNKSLNYEIVEDSIDVLISMEDEKKEKVVTDIEKTEAKTVEKENADVVSGESESSDVPDMEEKIQQPKASSKRKKAASKEQEEEPEWYVEAKAQFKKLFPKARHKVVYVPDVTDVEKIRERIYKSFRGNNRNLAEGLMNIYLEVLSSDEEKLKFLSILAEAKPESEHETAKKAKKKDKGQTALLKEPSKIENSEVVNTEVENQKDTEHFDFEDTLNENREVKQKNLELYENIKKMDQQKRWKPLSVQRTADGSQMLFFICPVVEKFGNKEPVPAVLSNSELSMIEGMKFTKRNMADGKQRSAMFPNEKARQMCATFTRLAKENGNLLDQSKIIGCLFQLLSLVSDAQVREVVPGEINHLLGCVDKRLKVMWMGDRLHFMISQMECTLEDMLCLIIEQL